MLSYSKDIIQDLAGSAEFIGMDCLTNLINFATDNALHDEPHEIIKLKLWPSGRTSWKWSD